MHSAFHQWVGRREVIRDVVDGRSVAQMDALLGGAGRWPAVGAPLPFGWQEMYFAPRSPGPDLGPDGHPKRGGFMPPIPLPRRMYGGTRLTVQDPLRVGDAIVCTREIAAITEKAGTHGPLVIVDISANIEAAGRPVLQEVRTILYCGASRAGSGDCAPAPAREDSDWRCTMQPDPVALFRFSALTFNGHRIHYDRSYARQVEGYRGLVVQGPYGALLLITAALNHAPGRTPRTFTCRTHAPLFDDAPFDLAGKWREGQTGMDLWTVRADGHTAMTACLGF